MLGCWAARGARGFANPPVGRDYTAICMALSRGATATETCAAQEPATRQRRPNNINIDALLFTKPCTRHYCFRPHHSPCCFTAGNQQQQ
jgi:hypothetical protein